MKFALLPTNAQRKSSTAVSACMMATRSGSSFGGGRQQQQQPVKFRFTLCSAHTCRRCKI
jgi:hypothetical protein